MRLTAAGRLLAGHGEKITTQLRQAERDLAELTGQTAGPVRIAAFQSVMAPLIGPVLRHLAAANPAIRPAGGSGDHAWDHYPRATPLYGWLAERRLLDPANHPLKP